MDLLIRGLLLSLKRTFLVIGGGRGKSVNVLNERIMYEKENRQGTPEKGNMR